MIRSQVLEDILQGVRLTSCKAYPLSNDVFRWTGRLHARNSRPAKEALLPLIRGRDATNVRENDGVGAWGHRILCLRRTSERVPVATMRLPCFRWSITRVSQPTKGQRSTRPTHRSKRYGSSWDFLIQAFRHIRHT